MIRKIREKINGRRAAKQNMGEDIFHKDIVDTFFGSNQNKKYTHYKKKKKLSPLRITVILLLIVFSVVFITVVIDMVRFNTRNFHIVKTVPKYVQPDTVKLLHNGIRNVNFVSKISFEGDAFLKSTFLQKSIKLVNNEKWGWARVQLKFWDLYDMSGCTIRLLGKSADGESHINVMLIDDNSNVITFKNITFHDRWRWADLRSDNNDISFDFSKVKLMSMEFGSLTVSNKSGAVIYVKELLVEKNKEESR